MVSMIGKAFLFAPMAFTQAMFPKVSAQNELGKKTRSLLVKTILYSLIVAGGGILLCNLIPTFLVRILMRSDDITQNALALTIPMLRSIGFVFTPFGLIFILINYHLACHRSSFLPFLILGVVLQVVLLLMFHQTLFQVLTMLFIAGICIFLLCLINPRFVIDKISKKR